MLIQPSSFKMAYVIHARVYRETSLIVELFSRDTGRLTVMAKGARRLRSDWLGLLQPFFPLWVDYVGQQELMTLTRAEAAGQPLRLQGQSLWSGFYLNELMLRLLLPQDPHVLLFEQYEAALNLLATQTEVEVVLRKFEKKLITSLGYAIDFEYEVETRIPIQSAVEYLYLPLRGFVKKTKHAEPSRLFSGAELRAVERETFDVPSVKAAAKRLFRQTLAPLLGDKPLKTREVYRGVF